MNFETTYGLLEKCSVALKEIPLDWIFPTVVLRRRRSFVVPSKEKILPSIDLQAKDHLFFFSLLKLFVGIIPSYLLPFKCTHKILAHLLKYVISIKT